MKMEVDVSSDMMMALIRQAAMEVVKESDVNQDACAFPNPDYPEDWELDPSEYKAFAENLARLDSALEQLKTLWLAKMNNRVTISKKGKKK